jgi:hypothetical protein
MTTAMVPWGSMPPPSWVPSYLRRSPRWHDGIGRLMDLGGKFDLMIPAAEGVHDAVARAEDLLMVREDLRRALEQLQHLAAER